MPTIYIIAGCNGAGKTTAAFALLRDVFKTDVFINADIIASQLNSTNPEAVAITAGRMMIDKVQNAIAQKDTFAIETTLATRIYFSVIKQAQLLGYEVILYFFYLPSTEMAKERVKLRVSKGGHFIPPDVIERRYHLGIKYFFEYLKLTDRWYIYNNSLTASTLIARGEIPNTVLIYNFELWEQLKKK